MKPELRIRLFNQLLFNSHKIRYPLIHRAAVGLCQVERRVHLIPCKCHVGEIDEVVATRQFDMCVDLVAHDEIQFWNVGELIF